MNCKEFKSNIADLFDTTISMQTRAECKAHMAECPACKAYYEELTEGFKALQPQDASSKQAVCSHVTKHHRLWHSAIAVAAFLFGIFIGWSHFFSTSAVAVNPYSLLYEQGIKSMQSVGNFQMSVYARTTPNENFAYFDPEADFVKIDIGLLRQNDSVFFRAEKQNGRTIVFDSQTQYMWIPNALYVKEPHAANLLENFVSLLHPEHLLAMQESAISFSKKNEVTRSETDSTIILTFKETERNNNLRHLLGNGETSDWEVEVENVFTKKDGLLRFAKLWIVNKGKKTLLLHTDHIQYNIMMSRKNLTQIPEAQWTEVAGVIPDMTGERLCKLQNETAVQATRRILQAIVSGNGRQACEALVYYENMLPTLTSEMKGCKVTGFKEHCDSDYIGAYVFYTLTYPDGRQEQKYIAIRNDNEKHIWIVDGGL